MRVTHATGLPYFVCDILQQFPTKCPPYSLIAKDTSTEKPNKNNHTLTDKRHIIHSNEILPNYLRIHNSNNNNNNMEKLKGNVHR